MKNVMKIFTKLFLSCIVGIIVINLLADGVDSTNTLITSPRDDAIMFLSMLISYFIFTKLFNGTFNLFNHRSKYERKYDKAKYRLEQEKIRYEAQKFDEERLNLNLKNIGLSKESDLRSPVQWLLDKPTWVQILLGKFAIDKYKEKNNG